MRGVRSSLETAMDAVRLHLGGEPQRPQGHSLAFVTALLGQMGAADAFAVKAAIVGAAFDEQQLVPLLVEAAGGVGDQDAGDDDDDDDDEEEAEARTPGWGPIGIDNQDRTSTPVGPQLALR